MKTDSAKFEIKYVNGSLFDAPKDTLLVHACNAKGVWGSGIAAQFKKRFPKEFEEYNKYCKRFESISIIGDSFTYNDVGCLITSSGYADGLDSKAEILVHTTLALDDLCSDIELRDNNKVASNMFNSGLFKVPWADTEPILSVFVKKYKLDWTVYEL